LAVLVQTGSVSLCAGHLNIDFPGEETMNVPARLACLTLTACCSLTAHAQDPEVYRTVHFADIGWTDIAATTALASA
jgi:hypothetical protein